MKRHHYFIMALLAFSLLAGLISLIAKNDIENATKLPKLEKRNAFINISEVERQFNRAIEENVCGIIHLDNDTPLYNISGFTLTETFPGSKVFMAPAKSTDFKTAQQVAEKCHIYWEESISDDQTFSFHSVPPGKYALFVKGGAYTDYKGPPLPYRGNAQGYIIKVSFHGGNSKYMMSAFEIRPRN